MLKLNIGAGYEKIPGYITIDSSDHCNPDYVLDIEKDSLPFDDNSVDEVICHHILEHLGDGFFHCLKEIYRVGTNNATLHIRVPHPKHDTFLIDPTHKRPIYTDTIGMFSKKRNKKDIENGGRETPLGLIYDVDFEVLSTDYILDSYYQEAFQNLPNEQCDFIARSQNNVILEIIMKVRVIKNECTTDS